MLMVMLVFDVGVDDYFVDFAHLHVDDDVDFHILVDVIVSDVVGVGFGVDVDGRVEVDVGVD